METNNVYPFFQKGAVLKSSDLNQIIDSFTLDDNGIRQLIGYGILEGLEIEFDSDTKEVSIKKGCAVAPNGELLILKEDRNLDFKTLEPKTGCLYIIADKEVIDNTKVSDENCSCDSTTNPYNSVREIEVDFGIEEVKICENLEICIPRWSSFCFEDEKIIGGLTTSMANVVNGYLKTAKCFPTCFNQIELSIQNVLNAILNSIITTDNVNKLNTIDICKAQYIYDYLKDLIAAQEEFLKYANQIRRTENPDRVYLGKIATAIAAATTTATKTTTETESATKTDKCSQIPCREIFCHFENEKKAKFYACRMMKLADAEVFGFPNLKRITNIKSQNEQSMETVKIENGNEKKPIRITPSAALSRPLSERAIPFYLKEDIRSYWNYELTASHQQDSIPYFEDVQGNHLICDLAKYDFFRVEGYCNMELKEVVGQIVELRSILNIAFDIRVLVLDVKESKGINTYYEDLQRQYSILRLQYFCQRHTSTNEPALQLPLLLAKYDVQKTNCASLPFDLLKSDFDKRRHDLIFKHYKQKHTGLEHFAGVPNGGTLVLCVVQGEIRIDNPDIAGDNKDKSDLEARSNNHKINYIVKADFSLPYRCCDSDGVVECLLEEELEVGLISTNEVSIGEIISKNKTIYSEWRDSDGKPIKVNSLEIDSGQGSNTFAAMSYCHEDWEEKKSNTNNRDVENTSREAKSFKKIKRDFQKEFDTIVKTIPENNFAPLIRRFKGVLGQDNFNNLNEIESKITHNKQLAAIWQIVNDYIESKLDDEVKNVPVREQLKRITDKTKAQS